MENESVAEIPAWRLVILWLQDIANLHPEQFFEINETARKVTLAHYEEIYCKGEKQ